MKKTMAILCTLLMTCLAFAASAEAPVSSLYKPNVPETFRALVGGKSFEAGITGWGSTGEDEDARFGITITVAERDRFDAAAVENLAVHDILRFGDGTTTMVMEVAHDEDVVTVKGSGNEE